jgi:hypothetical protein
MLEQLLNALTRDLELDPVSSPDENGMRHLALNSELNISLKELDPGVLFFSRIGKCPSDKKEELFMLLMKANFLGQGTGGAAIALDKDENDLTLSLALPYDMNERLFKESLEDFANYVDYWKAELTRFQTSAKHSIY